MLPVPVFSAWHPLWEKDEVTKGLAEAADSLASRRNQIHSGSGLVRNLQGFAPRLHDFFRLRRERAARLRQKDPNLLYRSYLSGIVELSPVIEASRWARWLALEQALADAMQHADLLFAALVLRTQIEDISNLFRLERIEREIPNELSGIDSVSRVTPIDLAKIEETVDFLNHIGGQATVIRYFLFHKLDQAS